MVMENAPLQAGFAETRGGNYALALAVVAGAAALSVALLTFFGRENHSAEFGAVLQPNTPAELS